MYRALTLSDLADGVHPNATGYRKMGAVWYDAPRSVPGGLTASISVTNTGSGAVTARNVSHNSTIPPNTSVDLGFQATHTGNSGPPSAFTLNGTARTVA